MPSFVFRALTAALLLCGAWAGAPGAPFGGEGNLGGFIARQLAVRSFHPSPAWPAASTMDAFSTFGRGLLAEVEPLDRTVSQREPSRLRKGRRNHRNNRTNAEKDERRAAREPVLRPEYSSPPAAVSQAPADPVRLGNGKWRVCIKGQKQSFGDVKGRYKSGAIIHADGRCVFMEYAGGFDGYFSIDAGDGKEDGMAAAVKSFLGVSGAVIGRDGAGREENKHVNAFLKSLREKADPLKLSYPADKSAADNGVRLNNIRRISRVCTQMIDVRKC